MRLAVRAALAMVLALTGCATAQVQSRWSRLEGCWVETTTEQPRAFLNWSADGAGGWRGEWRITAGNPDVDDAVDFTLTPEGDGMRLCQHREHVADECAPAFPSAAGAKDGDWVFEIEHERLAFGIIGREGLFFLGRRCG